MFIEKLIVKGQSVKKDNTTQIFEKITKLKNILYLMAAICKQYGACCYGYNNLAIISKVKFDFQQIAKFRSRLNFAYAISHEFYTFKKPTCSFHINCKSGTSVIRIRKYLNEHI